MDIFTQYGLDRSHYTFPNTNFSLRAKCRVRRGVDAGPGESIGQNICLGEDGKFFFYLGAMSLNKRCCVFKVKFSRLKGKKGEKKTLPGCEATWH